ncbi:M23 family metallopeptidase [Rubrivirga sp.]|uniref:M23 family metallopeptidase n=1 Tax=Rubrivirga sp. TaxID=1885344 RepID=UPI003B52D201
MRAFLLLLLVGGCGPDPNPLAPAPAPSERYARALAEAGLDSTRLGRAWVEAEVAVLDEPVALDLPASPGLTADAGAVAAAGWRIDLRRGEVLAVEVAPALADSARVFVDLFAADSSGARLGGWEVAVDTLRVERFAERDEAVVLVVRAELLAEGAVAVAVQTDPSLAFPVAGVDQDAIRSRWGAARDGGARSHEGIDIFADRGTPVVASAAGRVSRVQETPIGGRVVWLQTDLGSLYYAHLDRQLVEPGARVAVGDTLGDVGNTGNAAATPPHLHFGIYGRGGAVDPEPFVVGRRPAPRTRGE